MSWRQWAAAGMPDSNVFHLLERVLIDDSGMRTLCGLVGWKYRYMRGCTIREARERGLRLCKKCRARADEVCERLLEVDGEVGPDVPDPE